MSVLCFGTKTGCKNGIGAKILCFKLYIVMFGLYHMSVTLDVFMVHLEHFTVENFSNLLPVNEIIKYFTIIFD